MKTLNLCVSLSPRLLNSSTGQTESDLWRVGGLSVDSTSLTTELSLGKWGSQVRAGGSRNQRGQQQDEPAEVYGASASSGPGRGGRLEGETGEGVMTGQGGWIQGHGESHLTLAGRDNEHFRTSPSSTVKDSGHSFEGDKVDSSVWSIHSRAGQKVFTADESPDRKGDNSSILAGDRGGTAVTTKDRRHAKGMGTKGCLSPGEGAFIPFIRDQAKQASTTPTQHTTVLLCSVY